MQGKMQRDQRRHAETNVEVEIAPLVAIEPQHDEVVAAAAAGRQAGLQGQTRSQQERPAAKEQVIDRARHNDSDETVTVHVWRYAPDA